MLEQELFILGLLKEGPKHGYEIRKQMKQVSNIFTGLDTESIYYPLRMIEKKGLVTKSTGRSGKRPEKYVYQITSKGSDRLVELLNQSLITIQRPYFNIDLALYFLPYIPVDIIRRQLSVRLRMLRKIKQSLNSLCRSSGFNFNSHHLVIIKHNLELIKTEINFISDFVNTLDLKKKR